MSSTVVKDEEWEHGRVTVGEGFPGEVTFHLSPRHRTHPPCVGNDCAHEMNWKTAQMAGGQGGSGPVSGTEALGKERDHIHGDPRPLQRGPAFVRECWGSREISRSGEGTRRTPLHTAHRGCWRRQEEMWPVRSGGPREAAAQSRVSD